MYISHARMHSPPLPPPYTHNSWRRRSNSVTTLVHNLRRYQNSMSKETCLYEKRHDKETYIWHERTTCWGMKKVCQKRWIYMKRDMIKRPTYDMSAQFAEAWKCCVKVTHIYIWQKRPVYMKRDLIKKINNEMSRQIVKRDLCIWKETYYRDLCVWQVSHVRHVWQMRKLNSLTRMSKETCIYKKRPNTETYAYYMSRMCDMCDRRSNSCMTSAYTLL